MLSRVLVTDVVEMWEKMTVVRIMPFLGGALCGLHYLVLLIIRVRAAVWDSHTVAMAIIVLCTTIGSYCIYFYPSMRAATRRRSVVLLSFMYHIMPCISLVINAQIKRSSEAALLDAFVFTSNQFFFNRSTKLRVVLNFVSCFSWHYWKLFVPALSKERGHNLPHLLYALLIYTVSIYASFKVQPLIDGEVQRRKERERVGQAKERERAGQADRSLFVAT